jgi:hypothetical protein
MHREISHTDEVFAELFALPADWADGLAAATGDLAVAGAADRGHDLANLEHHVSRAGNRDASYALIGAVLGGARILYTSLESMDHDLSEIPPAIRKSSDDFESQDAAPKRPENEEPAVRTVFRSEIVSGHLAGNDNEIGI